MGVRSISKHSKCFGLILFTWDIQNFIRMWMKINHNIFSTTGTPKRQQSTHLHKIKTLYKETTSYTIQPTLTCSRSFSCRLIICSSRFSFVISMDRRSLAWAALAFSSSSFWDFIKASCILCFSLATNSSFWASKDYKLKTLFIIIYMK